MQLIEPRNDVKGLAASHTAAPSTIAFCKSEIYSVSINKVTYRKAGHRIATSQTSVYRTVGLLCVLAILAILLGSCQSSQPSGSNNSEADEAKKQRLANLNETGFPIVKEPIAFTFFSHKSNSNTGNWNEALVWKEYAELTGIEVDFQLTNVEVLPEKRNLIFSSNELPDAFHTAVIPAEDLVTYGSQGVLIPLNELIERYAPNLKAYMDAYPEVRKGMTMPDGNIYSFPSMIDPSFTSARIGSQLWINERFLRELNMEVPQTIDEIYAYFKAVKTQDPNRNGLNDEYPIAIYNMNWLIDQLKGAWGLGNRGNMHPRADVDPDTGQLRYIPIDAKFKELLQELNRYYKEDFFYKDVFIVKPAEISAKFPDGLFGSFIGVNPNLSIPNVSGYVGVGALEGPYGDQLFSRIKSMMPLLGGFSITKANRNPEAAVRWIDYFYSDEGIKLFLLGVENESYITEDGRVRWVDELRHNPVLIGKYVTWAGGWYPSVLKQQYFLGQESDAENLRISEQIAPYLPKEIWPTFTYPTEEVGEFTALESALEQYVNEMTMKFINGSIPFIKWREYVETVHRLGLARYLELYKKAYDRYEKH